VFQTLQPGTFRGGQTFGRPIAIPQVTMATDYTRKANKVKLAASAAAAPGSFTWDALEEVPRKAQRVPDAS
jgi:hypothetical protein